MSKGEVEMSIFPKKLVRGVDDFTTFHMKICNNSTEAVEGTIKYKIIIHLNTYSLSKNSTIF